MQLLDLAEIADLWGLNEFRIYRAVSDGRLRAYGRPGRQKYYSAVEVIAEFGCPRDPRPDDPPEIARLRDMVASLTLSASWTLAQTEFPFTAAAA